MDRDLRNNENDIDSESAGRKAVRPESRPLQQRQAMLTDYEVSDHPECEGARTYTSDGVRDLESNAVLTRWNFGVVCRQP